MRNRLAYLRAACRWAWKHHQMGEHDPAERMVLPKVRNERHVYLDRKEFLKICRKVRPGGERAAIRIAFYSGMRAAEVGAASLMFGEFCLSDSKNGERRIIPVHPKVAHITRNAALWPIQPTRWTVSKAFKAAARLAGFPDARLHDLRHSTASEMINSGIDLYTVGAVLGHKSAVSTKRYSHLATATLASALGTVVKKSQTRYENSSAKKSLVFIGRMCEIRTRDQRIKSTVCATCENCVTSGETHCAGRKKRSFGASAAKISQTLFLPD